MDGGMGGGVDGAGPERAAGRVAPLRVVVVRGRSMLPTLHDGDRLLARTLSTTDGPGLLRPGRLVLVRLPGGRPTAIKRATHREDQGWWVERDSPTEGVDSWQVGAIADHDVLAVVIARIWPRPRRL